jgi:hypothetical protein
MTPIIGEARDSGSFEMNSTRFVIRVFVATATCNCQTIQTLL